jgi:transcriptional regulator GlxA family with amidase domain
LANTVLTPVAPLRVVVLAHDGMNLLDFSGPVQTLFTASRLHTGRGAALYEVLVASELGGPVTTSAGVVLMTTAITMLDGLAVDTVIAPGGCHGDVYRNSPGMVAWLRKQAPTLRRLCSVCTGAFLLAEAGLLDGRQVATHWDWVARLQASYPNVSVDPDKIFIRDGALWTSAGVTAGIDLTLALVEEDYGHAIAIETARQLVMFIKRPGGQSQFSVPLAAQSREGKRFDALHAWVAGNLAADLRVEQLAERAGMSPRSFARIYSAQAGRTPAKMVESMRLEAACRALEQTQQPLKGVAAETGHGDEQNLRRVFLRRLGVTPGQYRERFSAYRP